MKKKNNRKLFILRMYVMARNAREALRIAKTQEFDDVYVSDDWKEGKNNQLAGAIGFEAYPPSEEEE